MNEMDVTKLFQHYDLSVTGSFDRWKRSRNDLKKFLVGLASARNDLKKILAGLASARNDLKKFLAGLASARNDLKKFLVGLASARNGLKKFFSCFAHPRGSLKKIFARFARLRDLSLTHLPAVAADATPDWHIERANWSKRIFLINVQNFLPRKLF